MTTLAQQWFDVMEIESRIEDGILDAGLEDFDKIGGDWYDNSIEIYGVENDTRLNEATKRFLLEECGFSKVYVNHKDGRETHYSSVNEPGWRRFWVKDESSKHDRVIVGEPDPGHWEVSRFPEGWPQAWLDNGYVVVVPDPFE